ncbi:MAG TPA: hypothetical protein VGB66_12235 [Longimicrobium sp.]
MPYSARLETISPFRKSPVAHQLAEAPAQGRDFFVVRGADGGVQPAGALQVGDEGAHLLASGLVHGRQCVVHLLRGGRAAVVQLALQGHQAVAHRFVHGDADRLEQHLRHFLAPLTDAHLHLGQLVEQRQGALGARRVDRVDGRARHAAHEAREQAVGRGGGLVHPGFHHPADQCAGSAGVERGVNGQSIPA